ncbi:MAG TPA: hypothetical protein VN036_00535 [Devosia sp.]|nr:hypothetical protein [Devosia sp.]
MSLLTLDLRNVRDEDFATEALRRIRKGDISATSLGLVLDLEDFEAGDLIDEVNKRLKAGTIDPEEIEVKTETGGGTSEDQDIDHTELEEAAARFARRDYPETLWCLEKALGRQFAGLGDLKVGQP